MTRPPTAAARASNEPIEMSIPPAMMTTEAPSARIASAAALTTIPCRLAAV